MNRGVLGFPVGFEAFHIEDEDVAVTTTAAETPVVSIPIPIALLRPGGFARLLAWGDALHNTAAGDFIYLTVRANKTRMVADGVTIARGTINTGNFNSVTRRPWLCGFDFLGIGDGRIMFAGGFSHYARSDDGSAQVGSCVGLSESGTTVPPYVVYGPQYLTVSIYPNTSSANLAATKFGTALWLPPQSSAYA